MLQFFIPFYFFCCQCGNNLWKTSIITENLISHEAQVYQEFILGEKVTFFWESKSMRGRLSIEDWYVILSQLLKFRISSKTRKRKEHCIQNLKHMLRRFETGISKSHMRGEKPPDFSNTERMKMPTVRKFKIWPRSITNLRFRSLVWQSPVQLYLQLSSWWHWRCDSTWRMRCRWRPTG